ncbi:MAG: hypothetical protein Q6K90_02495 [Gloeomargarita sp. HHBFW_bins_162]
MDRREEIIAEENQKRQERGWRRVYHLSQCSYGLTIFLGLLIPIGAYIYTRRWRAMVIFLAIAGLVGLIFAPDTDEWEPSPVFMVLGGVAAVVDNTQAIRWAKKQIGG